MKYLFPYFRIEIKRTVRMLPWFFGSILFLAIFVFFGTAAISHLMGKAQVFETITVDLAIPKEETKVKQIAEILSNMESVKHICRFQYTSEAEARMHVKNGEADAALLVSDQFYQDMETGKNTPAVLLLPEHRSLGQTMFQQLVSDGVSLIRTTEAAIYAATDAGKIYGMKVSREEMEDLIFYCYLEKAFFRGEIFQKKILSPTGEFDLTQYYFVSFLLICLLMSGLNFAFLYHKQEKLIEEKLKAYGLGSISISLVKVLTMGMVLWMIGMILLIVLAAIENLGIGGGVSWNPSAVFGILPIVLSISGFFHVIYTCAGNVGGILIFLLNGGMMVCSGILVPVGYLPKPVQIVGRIMPLTFWEKHGMEVLFGGFEIKMLLVEIALITAGILLGAFMESIKWKRESYGLAFFGKWD